MSRKAPRTRPQPRVPAAAVRHTTVPEKPPRREPRPQKPAPRVPTPKPLLRKTPWAHTTAPKRQAARLVDPDDSTVLDLIDNLLNKGVVLSADLILALANVDLVYIRLSALLCAADRITTGPRR